MMLQTDPSPWPHIYAALWLQDAAEGTIRLPRMLHGWAEQAVLLCVRQHCMYNTGKPLSFIIDTHSTGEGCWPIAQMLVRDQQRGIPGRHTAIIGRHCHSGALTIALGCGKRIAVPHADFVFHGEDIHRRKDEDDAMLADFYASRTAQPREFWMRLAADAEDHHFGAEEALEWGVIHKVEGQAGAE